MKPFNLEQALQGKAVQTRDGRPVTQITLFHTSSLDTMPLFGVVDNEVYCFSVNGRNCITNEDCSKDLFMVEEEMWIKVYPGNKPGVHIYTTFEEAIKSKMASLYEPIGIFKLVAAEDPIIGT